MLFLWKKYKIKLYLICDQNIKGPFEVAINNAPVLRTCVGKFRFFKILRLAVES